MKHDGIDDRATAEKKADLEELKAAVRTESESVLRRDEAMRELVRTAHEGTSVDPDEMEDLCESVLRNCSNHFPSLLDLHGGDTRWAARKACEHMANAAAHGDTKIHWLALMELEEIAAEIKFSPSRLWTPDSDR